MMISTAGGSMLQREWFNLVPTGCENLSYGVPKSGFQDQVRAAFQEMETRAEKNYEALTERVQSGKKTKLTEEQQAYLRENFDPKSMTRAEYQAFVDKLCEFGVLDEADKPYVSYGIPGGDLDFVPLTVFHGRDYLMAANGENPMGYTNSFGSSGGNVLSWTRYLAGLQSWGERGFEFRPESILFGRMRDALESIAL